MNNEIKECNVATCEYWATPNNCKKCENTCKYFGFGGCKLEMESCYKIDDCYYKQLLAKQAYIKELNKQISEYYVPLEVELAAEQAKNKKLVKALEKIVESKCSECDLYVAHLDICGADKSYEANGKRHKEICWEHCTNKLLKLQRTALQALNEVNNDSKEVEND